MTGIESTALYKNASWVHAEAPTDDEIRELCTQFDLHERIIRDALDRDEIPRVDMHKNYSYIITRFAYKTSAGAFETAPLLFAINAKRLVTVSLEQLPSLRDVMPDQSDGGEHLDPAHVMLLILLKIDADYDQFIHDSSKEIRHLLEKLGTRNVGTKSFIRFVHIERDMNDFLNALQPTNAALRNLTTIASLASFSAHQDLVRTVLLNNEQSIQACEANLKSVTSIRRTYALINSHNLDRTIKILTMISVFLAIPTMYFSMYGMNIGLPWQRSTAAFAGLMVVCLLTILTAYALGRNRKIF